MNTDLIKLRNDANRAFDSYMLTVRELEELDRQFESRTSLVAPFYEQVKEWYDEEVVNIDDVPGSGQLTLLAALIKSLGLGVEYSLNLESFFVDSEIEKGICCTLDGWKEELVEILIVRFDDEIDRLHKERLCYGRTEATLFHGFASEDDEHRHFDNKNDRLSE